MSLPVEYEQFCDKYGLPVDSQDSRDEYNRYRENLTIANTAFSDAARGMERAERTVTPNASPPSKRLP